VITIKELTTMTFTPGVFPIADYNHKELSPREGDSTLRCEIVN